MLYVDPPYLRSTRSSRQYHHEMSTPEEHRELADALAGCQATVVVSGYPSPLYDELYDGWYSVALPAFTGQAGTRGDRTEVLWSNRPLAGVEEGLFDTASEFRYADGDDDAPCNETSKCVVCGGVMQRAATGRRKPACGQQCTAISGTGTVATNVPLLTNPSINRTAIFESTEIPLGQFTSPNNRFTYTYTAPNLVTPVRFDVDSPHWRCDNAAPGLQSTGCVYREFTPSIGYNFVGEVSEFARHVRRAQTSGLPGSSASGQPLHRLVDGVVERPKQPNRLPRVLDTTAWTAV